MNMMFGLTWVPAAFSGPWATSITWAGASGAASARAAASAVAVRAAGEEARGRVMAAAPWRRRVRNAPAFR